MIGFPFVSSEVILDVRKVPSELADTDALQILEACVATQFSIQMPCSVDRPYLSELRVRLEPALPAAVQLFFCQEEELKRLAAEEFYPYIQLL